MLRPHPVRPLFIALWSTALLLLGGSPGQFPASAEEARPKAPAALHLVVMDPLAAPLSCPCVQGYAQRDYDKLAAFLKKTLNLPVEIVYAESLSKGLKKLPESRVDIVIGKHSVIVHDLAALGVQGQQAASLTGKEGGTTQTGLILVASGDPAKKVSDLQGYRIIFGPRECDEKHAAALAILKGAGVAVPEKLETSDSCSDGATIILELEKGQHGAAVISSYAKPLLEGCGTVKKGDLRVLAETAPVPFIAAFTTSTLPQSLRERVASALLEVADDPELCRALETKDGFVKPDAAEPVAATAASTAAAKKK